MPCWWSKRKSSTEVVPIVNGSAVCKKQQIIPVPLDTNVKYFESLVASGWRTDGITEVLDGNTCVWYCKEEDRKSVPSLPSLDEKTEYTWQRIIIEELAKHQAQGWFARAICDKTNRIWICRPRGD